MKRKIYLLPVLFLSITVVLFSSCLGSDDNTTSLDEAWMWRNATEFNTESLSGNYQVIDGIADPSKYILWKESGFEGWTGSAVTDLEQRVNMRSAVFSDTVKVRYDGWYLDNEGRRIIFDSTERRTTLSPTSDPNKVARIMRVGDLIDGWRVALYRMKEGDEWRVVIPYQLGYGMSASGSIPACTTLYFDLKLVGITSKSN